MDDVPARLLRVSRFLDAASRWSARLFAWLIIPLMGAMTYEVVARYTVNPTAWAYDTSYMLYGALFMLGAAYTLSRGAHIRADFLYRQWPTRVQGAVDAFCYLAFFFPGIGFFFWIGAEFAYDSWLQLERSPASAWMPPIYPLKSVLPVASLLLLVQGVSELIKSLHAALKGEWP
jgi:TRAP-type mannitol/chloroaromatic compound transport system permease small subunit